MTGRTDRPGTATCEVWWATPSEGATLTGLLDEVEVTRARGMRLEGARDRFVTARALLRLVLADRTGVAPTELHLDTTCHRCGAQHGKPRLIGGGRPEQFSIAHSADRVVVVAADVPVGVDVESVEDRRAEELASLSTSILAPEELADYRRLPHSRRGRALATWWTRKEALLKATGDGLAVPMRDVAVTAPEEPAALRSDGSRRRRAAAMAALQDLAAGEGQVACVATLGVSSLTITERDGDELLARARTAQPTVAAAR